MRCGAVIGFRWCLVKRNAKQWTGLWLVVKGKGEGQSFISCERLLFRMEAQAWWEIWHL